MSRISTLVAAAVLTIALAACGSTTKTTTAHPVAVSAAPTTTSATEASGWSAKWCTVQVGMTKAQVYAIMGKPTAEYQVDVAGSTNPQASWHAYQYGFTAFFDAQGKARQLDINLSKLSSAEKAKLRCSDIR